MNIFKSKRGGAESTMLEETGKFFLGAAIVLLFIILIIMLFNVLYSGDECANIGEWKKIETAVNSLKDKEAGAETVFFYNGGTDSCKLVAFSNEKPNTYSDLYYRGGNVPPYSAICLCEIDNVICNAKKCMKVEENLLTDVSGRQFHTVGASNFINLVFEKAPDALFLKKIDSTNTVSMSYQTSAEYSAVDKGLIKDISIDMTNVGGATTFSFAPHVILDNSGTLPADLGGLPTNPKPIKFKLYFISLKADTTPEQILADEATFWKNDYISHLDVTFKIPESFIAATGTNNVHLSYLYSGTWTTLPLNCNQERECKFYFEHYPEEIIISA